MQVVRFPRVFAAVVAFVSCIAAAQVPLPSPNVAIKTNGIVYAVAVQADGKVVIGGLFDSVNGTAKSNIARLNTDGTLDSAFAATVSGWVSAIALNGTDIYIGGNFTQVNGTARGNIARLDAGGSLNAWTMNAVYTGSSGIVDVRVLTVSGTSLYIGGLFTSLGGTARSNLARMSLSTGALNSTFLPNPNAVVEAVAVDGSNVYVGGEFTFIGGQGVQRLARVSFSTGEADPLFALAPNQFVRSIVISGTYAYVAGTFNTIGGQPRYRIAKVDLASNAVVAGWNATTVDPVIDGNALILFGGDIVLGGQLTASGVVGTRVHRLAAADGSAIPGWDVLVHNNTFALAVSGSNLIVGGSFSAVSVSAAASVTRLGASGAVDTGFLPVVTAPGAGSVMALARQPDGKLVVGGDFLTVNGELRPNLFRLNADGSVDTAWNPAPNGFVYSVAATAGGVYAGGAFSRIGGAARSYIAKLDPTTGALDAAFATTVNGVVYKVLHGNASVYLAGQFTITNGDTPAPVVRVDESTGAVAAGWNWENLFFFNGYAWSLALNGGRLMVGGSFTQVGPAVGGPYTRQHLVALGATSGNVDLGFTDPQINWDVTDIAFGPDGSTAYVVGGFNMVAGVTQRAIAAIGPSGNRLAFAGEPGGYYCGGRTVVATAGAVFFGGSCSAWGGTIFHLVKLSPSGVADPTFLPQPQGNDVAALLLDGPNLLVGGSFTAISGVARTALASLPPLPTQPGQPNMTDATDSGTYNNDNVTNFSRPTFSGTCGTGDTVRLRVDGTPVAPTITCSGGLYTITPDNPLADGNYTISAIASNNGLDSAPSSGSTIFIRLLANTSILAAPPVTTASTTASFSFTANDEDATFECRLDSGYYMPCYSPQEYTGLSNAQHTFYVRSTDLAGNVDATPATHTWSVGTGFLLSVNKSGSGLGNVSSAPTGIDCGATCNYSFASGTPVTLYAAPAIDSSFVTWIGCPSPSGNQCAITMSAPAEVTAVFAREDVSFQDFNADGHPDILWSNTANGATYVWYMTGQPPVLDHDAFIAQIDPSWKVQGVADFNGDGKPDLIWRNTANGNTYVWYMDGAAFVSDAFVFSLPPQWVIQGVADFNADHKPDFLMRNVDPSSGVAFIWFFYDNAPIGDQFLFGIDPAWKVEQVGDVDGDGQPDLLFRNMDSGLAFAWFTQWSGGAVSLAGSSSPIFSIDPVWEIVQLADWDGDSQPDLLFRNADSGLVFVWYMVNLTLGGSDYVIQIDPSWEIVPRR